MSSYTVLQSFSSSLDLRHVTLQSPTSWTANRAVASCPTWQASALALCRAVPPGCNIQDPNWLAFGINAAVKQRQLVGQRPARAATSFLHQDTIQIREVSPVRKMPGALGYLRDQIQGQSDGVASPSTLNL
ncbi:hypothetical protein KCU99_g56, partial [Aureobasidium melanogenum]